MTRVLKGEALAMQPVAVSLAVCAVLTVVSVVFVARHLRAAAVR
jgi:sodium transport system permease protein